MLYFQVQNFVKDFIHINHGVFKYYISILFEILCLLINFEPNCPTPPPTLGSRIYKERISSDMKSAYNIVCLLLIFSRNIFCPVYTELGQTQIKMELHITLISVELVSLDLIGWVDFVL